MSAAEFRISVYNKEGVKIHEYELWKTGQVNIVHHDASQIPDSPNTAESEKLEARIQALELKVQSFYEMGQRVTDRWVVMEKRLDAWEAENEEDISDLEERVSRVEVDCEYRLTEVENKLEALGKLFTPISTVLTETVKS